MSDGELLIVGLVMLFGAGTWFDTQIHVRGDNGSRPLALMSVVGVCAGTAAAAVALLRLLGWWPDA